VVSDYRLAPALAARLTGALLVLAAAVVLGTTVVTLLARLPVVVVLAVALLLALVLAPLAWWLLRRAVVLHTDEQGYRVRLVRGTGTRAAAWRDVEDAVASWVAGSPCIVLRLRDGRTTTIPVEAVAGDRDQLVRDVQDRLQHGHGLSPLRRPPPPSPSAEDPDDGPPA
jgi:hypothetical protein